MKVLTQIILLSFATVLYSAIMAVAQQSHAGDLFNFIPSLGACGFTNTPTQIVASVSSIVFNTFPGATANPNRNPICNRKLFIKSTTNKNINITAQLVDFFTAHTNSKTVFNIGLSAAAFAHFAPLDDGIFPNITWSFV